jgi:hypothetical protein
MKNNSQLKYQNITYIKGLKEIYCALVLKDGRIAIGNNYLKIYNGISFNFDFEIKIKKFLDKRDRDFTFHNLIYMKNGDILVNNNHKIFFIIKIIDNEKKYNILEKFESNRQLCWITRICELSNNSIATIGVPYDIEIFSKNDNNKYYSSKIIKDAHKRDGYKTLIEIPDDKIMTFSGKLYEFKVWDLNNYECIFRGEINYPECGYNMIYLILNRYVLIQCNNGLTIIDINNNYNIYLALKNISVYSMISLDETEFLILTEKDIRKINLNMDNLKFKVEQSDKFLNKKGYSLGHILVKINENTYMTNFDKNEFIYSEGCDSTLLIFKYYNN